MSLPDGTRLGPCESNVQIGAGGMGEVYKARPSAPRQLRLVTNWVEDIRRAASK